MAYNPNNLIRWSNPPVNITPNTVPTSWGYFAANDTAAEILTAGYFSFFGNSSASEVNQNFLNEGDLIWCRCVDVNIQVEVTVPSPNVTVVQVFEASFTTVNHAILLGGAGDAIGGLLLTNGQVAVGVTGSDPVAVTLPGAGGVVEVVGTTQAMAVNTTYIANNGALVTLTLPAVAPLGSEFIIRGKGVGLFKIAQNAGQTINLLGTATTAGVGGSLTTTGRYDAIKITAITANTTFSVDWVASASITIV